MEFKKVNFDELRLKKGDPISKSYIRLIERGSRLEQFVVNDKKTDSEPTESLSATDYLEPVEEHGKILHEYAEKVQSVINNQDNTLPSWPAVRSEEESFEEFVNKGSDALIKDHEDLVKKLI